MNESPITRYTKNIKGLEATELWALDIYIGLCKNLSTDFMKAFNRLPCEVIFDTISVTKEQELHQQLTEHFAASAVKVQSIIEQFEKGL